MASQRIQRFIDALGSLEQSGDVELLASLYGADAEIGNVVSAHEFRGVDGARDFWQRYRESFGDVTSTFRNVIEAEEHAALEWTSYGTSADGADFEYEGVSILEFDGDRITRFRAFFDPSKLGHQLTAAK